MHRLPQEASDALDRLMAGSVRARTATSFPTRGHARARELVASQRPFAVVLGCVDSRVVPEFVFHQEPGSIVVARIPGNVLGEGAVATIEFAIAELHVPLVFVLGHSNCGAVHATIASISKRTRIPRGLRGTVRALSGAVKQTRRAPGDWLENATAENVRRVATALPRRSRLLSAALKENAAGVAGGIYDIGTETVTRLL